MLYEEKEEITIPLDIFRHPSGILECIVKYLKEDKNLKFSKISRLLKRDQRTIWNSYFYAKKKYKPRFSIKNIEPSVPISVFADRTLSPLESISFSLKEKSNLNYRTIAKLLNRNERNIWAAVAHAKKKYGSKKTR